VPKRLTMLPLFDFARRPRLIKSVLSYRAAEPVRETRRPDARVVARGERLIVQLYAVVPRMDVCDYRTSVVLRAQESPHEFVLA
jgi:hypothetical protein